MDNMNELLEAWQKFRAAFDEEVRHFFADKDAE
jgi:hypothetical protein